MLQFVCIMKKVRSFFVLTVQYSLIIFVFVNKHIMHVRDVNKVRRNFTATFGTFWKIPQLSGKTATFGQFLLFGPVFSVIFV